MTDKDTSEAKDLTAPDKTPETEQKDSPLQAWIARSEVKRIMELDPDIIRQEANSDVERRSDTPKDLTALGSVERFHASEFSGTMIPSPCGDWVRHSDYDVLSAALEAKNDALTRATFRADVHENRAEASEAERTALKAELAEAVETLSLIAVVGFSSDLKVSDAIAKQVVNQARAFLARHQKETDT